MTRIELSVFSPVAWFRRGKHFVWDELADVATYAEIWAYPAIKTPSSRMNCLSRCIAAMSLASALTLLSTCVNACGVSVERTHSAIFGRLHARAGVLPDEISVRAGDLISVLLPMGVKVGLVDSNDQSSGILVPITADQFQALRKQVRDSLAPEYLVQGYPKHLEWRHFGAASDGVIYLKLSAANEHGLVRVKIDVPPVIKRGETLHWNENRQLESIRISQFDRLIVDLPGKSEDGWKAQMLHGKAVIKSVAYPRDSEDAAGSRVLLDVDVNPGAMEDKLTLTRSGGYIYRFTLQSVPIPKC